VVVLPVIFLKIVM